MARVPTDTLAWAVRLCNDVRVAIVAGLLPSLSVQVSVMPPLETKTWEIEKAGIGKIGGGAVWVVWCGGVEILASFPL